MVLQVLRPGEMAGELGFIDGLEHSAAIRALNNVEVFSLTRPELEKLLDEDRIWSIRSCAPLCALCTASCGA
ncbi:MAG: cyclic nucleotide-binding domain-containing protein [Candidatus Thiothrix singaporensis]|uniref:Cyclic nucleotide-binding domain-containing protein n=1 Tax=Candidatus Thiothrix singaporensis TaxID=2799669 RepID=A0A7L6AS69_9GAMM|nr:MAG: cyclic nucleotide-binding domain-containing protein [Candidatus Thiothrix singaporensis]